MGKINRRSGDYKNSLKTTTSIFDAEVKPSEKIEVSIKDMDPEQLFQIKMISLNKIDSHENNTYELKAIEPLAINFVRHRMWQTPLVKQAYDEEYQRTTGRYIMIAGHRRKEAYVLIHSIAELLVNGDSLDPVYKNSKPEMHDTLNKLIEIIKTDPEKFRSDYSSLPCVVLAWNCSKEEEESALNDTNIHNRQTEADEALKQIEYILKDNDMDTSLPVRDLVAIIKNQFDLLGYTSWGNSKIRSYLLAYIINNDALNHAIMNNQLSMKEMEYLVVLPPEQIDTELENILNDSNYLAKAKAQRLNKAAQVKKGRYKKVNINVEQAAKKLTKLEPDLIKFREANNILNDLSEEDKKEKIKFLKKFKKDFNSSLNNLITLLETDPEV